MRLDEATTDGAVLAELGRRLERHRLERNLTQAELAAVAGLGQATVQRAERGESVQMTSMIKLLRALGVLAGLELALPESIELPIAQLEREQRAADRTRRRARGRRAAREEHSASAEHAAPDERPGAGGERWTWGAQPGPAA